MDPGVDQHTRDEPKLPALVLSRGDDEVGGGALEEVLHVPDGAEQPVPDHFGGLARDVGGQNGVRQPDDRIGALERLLVKDVEPRRQDLPLA